MTLDELKVYIRADASGLEKELRKVGAVTQAETRKIENDSKRMEKAFTGVNKSIAGVTSSLFSFRNVLTPVLGAVGAGQILRMADEWKVLEGRLRIATSSAAEMRVVQSELFDIAQRTSTPISASAELYSKLAMAAKELAASQSDMLTVTEAVGNAVAISGGSSASAAGALLQFSQAIGGAVIQAQEFNSIMDGAPRLAQAAADGIDRAGGSVARLRSLIISGQVTSREFFEAIRSQAAKLADEYAQTEGVVSRSVTRLGNALTKFVGTSATVNAATGAITFSIDALTDNLDLLADVGMLVATVFGVNMARSFAVSVAASLAAQRQAALTSAAYLGLASSAGTATVASRALTATLAFFGGPVGLAIAAVAGAMVLFATRTTEAERAARTHNEAMQKAIEIQGQLAGATGKVAEEMKKKRDETLAAARADLAAAEAALTLAEAEARQLNVHNALLVSRTGMSPTGGPLTLGEMGGIADARAALEQRRKQLADLEQVFKSGTTTGDKDGKGGGGGKSARAALPDYDDSAFAKYLRDLQDEADALHLSERQLAIRKAVMQAQSSAQQDFNAGLRDSSLLYAEEQAQVEQLAGSYYDLQEAIEQQKEEQRAAAETAREWTKELADGLTDVAMNFDSAGDAAAGFFRQIANNLMKQHVTGPLSSGLSSMVGGLFSGGFNNSGYSGLPWQSFGSVNPAGGIYTGGFGGFFADGGNPPVGVPSIVGERGPEIFVPKTAGTIIPNHAMGGQSVNVQTTFVINDGVTQQQLASMIPYIEARTEARVFAAIERGGVAAKSVGRRAN